MLTLKEALILESKIHPKAQIEDYFKLIYQSTFGPKHLLNDNFLSIISEDISSPNKLESYDLYQDIGYGYIRLNLVEYINEGYDITKLYQLVISSLSYALDSDFNNNLKIFKELISKEIKNISLKDFDNFYQKYQSSPKLIRHSNIYKDIYKPHYLVIKYESFLTIIK